MNNINKITVLTLFAVLLTAACDIYAGLFLPEHPWLITGLSITVLITSSIFGLTVIKALKLKKITSASQLAAKSEIIFSSQGHAIINQLDIGMAIVDPQGRILSCNQLALEIFNSNTQKVGFPQTIGAGLNIEWKAKPSDDYQMACFSRETEQRCIIEYMTKEISTNGETQFLVTIRDVTDRISVEAELATYRLRLEELVTQRSQALIQARDRAIEAHQEKNTFLANMTHELRTPLNAIIGYCELLDEETQENQHTQYNEDIKKIQSSAQVLKRLVNDVLEIQESEENLPQLSIDRINLEQLISEAASECENIINSNANRLLIELAPNVGEIEGDAAKIKKIIFNLLENAAKFTHNGEILITAKLHKQHDHDYVCIAVKDKGMGIAANDAVKVFEKFRQLDSSTTRNYDGAGLGLAVCKRLAIIMGGDISLKSKPNVGSTFTLTLPVTAIKSNIDPASIRFTGPAPKKQELRHTISRVLVLDNNIFTRTLICRFLSQQGFYADPAANINEVENRISNAAPDVILFNNEDSLDRTLLTLQEIKSLNIACTPKMIISTKSNNALQLQLGINANIIRPLNTAQLNNLMLEQLPQVKNQKPMLLVIDDDSNTVDLLQQHMKDSALPYITHLRSASTAIADLQEYHPSMVLLGSSYLYQQDSQLIKKIVETLRTKNIPFSLLVENNSPLNESINAIIDQCIDSSPLGTPELLFQIKNAITDSIRNQDKLANAPCINCFIQIPG